MYKILEDNFYLENKFFCTEIFNSNTSGIKLLEVHGMRKNLDPNLRPEKQHTLPK